MFRVFLLTLSFILLFTSPSFAEKELTVEVIEQPVEDLYARLGYCSVPPPPQGTHGIYYVYENGKCVPKVK